MIQPIPPHTSVATPETTCRHCGADLLGAGLPAITGETAGRFCCEGCRVVHGLLSGPGDGGGVYYDLLDQARAKAPRGGLAPGYRAYLESLRDPETLRRIGRWEGGTHSLTLECSEMQCAACGWLMERVLGQTEGVVDFEVDFIHGEMNVRYDAGQTLLPRVLESVGRYGYAFKPKAAFGSAAPRSALDRAAWMRLAVAAACFMNAMAFSSGPYLGFGVAGGMDDDWMRTLGLWSFASTLPAVFYSGFPFYQGAWRALRGRAFTIDVTVTIGIALAFGVSLASLFSSIGGGAVHSNYSDTLAGLVFFLLLGRYAVRRFEGGLMLRNRWHEALCPDAVRVVDPAPVNPHGGDAATGLRWTPLDQVVPGDLIEVAAGEYLPVDGTVESGTGAVDTAFLTGEDRPRPVAAGDFLFAGYRVLGVPVRLRVVNPHQRTRAAGLRRALESLVARKRRRNINRERVALGFTLTVAAAALLALLLHLPSGWEKALITAAAVFIVSCSCALALAVPVSRGVGLLRAHRLGFHFRDQETLERLAETRSVLFDKTGTLTFTRRTLARWEWTRSFAVDARIRDQMLGAVARLTGMSSHPVAAALHAALARQETAGRIVDFSEIPHFGLAGTWSDPADRPPSPQRLVVCRFGAWERNADAFLAQGLEAPRAGTLPAEDTAPQSCLFVEGRLAALIWLGEDIKPGASALLKELGGRGVAVQLLSGDHPDRVEDFARRCGFSEYQGGLSPEEKQSAARAFQERHGPSLAVGDGYNDSLLFGEAAVSLAVQGAAGPVAAEADAFMTAPDPERLLSLLRVAEGTRRSLRNCYIVSGVYNAGAISLAVAGLVSPLTAAILMPIASLSLCLTAWVTIPGK